MTQKIKNDLIECEGKVNKVYDDKTGKKINGGSAVIGNPTIGVGRNLSGKGLSDDEIEYLLNNDINECIKDLEDIFSDFSELEPNVQRALVNMRFNLGHYGFRKFKHMISAVKARDFKTAKEEIKSSKWCRQVGSRCKFVSDLIYKG